MNTKVMSENTKKEIIPNKSLIIKIILLVASLITSFLIQTSYYKPNFGTMIDTAMDAQGNVFILSVLEKKEQYKVTKIASNGVILFEKKLDKSSGNEFFKYKNLEVDLKGNFFLVQEVKNLDTIVSNPSQYPISKEIVYMYNYNGDRLKDVASLNFASEGTAPTNEYIRKLQIVGQELSIICSRDTNYKIVGVNPYQDQSPEERMSFSVSPPYSDTNVDWICDSSVLSNGNVVYSTKSGGLFLISSDGNLTDCSTLLPDSENSIVSMSIDISNNIYFINLRTGSFYKFDTTAMNVSPVYSINDSIKLNDLILKDFRNIRAINENDYFATSKSYVHPYFARLGSNQTLISNIKYNFWPYGLLYTIAGACLLLLIMIAIYKLTKLGYKRTYLSVKTTLMFLPIFAIIMSFVVKISADKSLRAYTEVLRQNQSIGAKIVAEKIDGDKLQNMISGSQFMSTDFASMKTSMFNAYIDLKDKVGDNSDYIVIYSLDNNKMYSIANSKYAGDYKYYENLKYADPDMTQDKIAVVDSLLERDEIENIYSVWNKLKDNEAKGILSTFRDVHGNLSSYFVPIKNSSGTVVGMVGNFLDEKTHVNNKFIEILKDSSTFIGISSILIFAYLCLIIWILLKPMRVLNHGIEVMINGHWKNRVPIISRDEFARISVAFNNMSDKLEDYTDNLMDLNSEYLRFVPKELLNLMGKEKITQADVGTGKTSEMSMVYITFNVGFIKKAKDFERTLFSILQEGYSTIFDIVEEHNGTVQNFSSLGAVLLFDDPVEALHTSFQILGSKIDSVLKNNIRISIGYGESYVGIIGNDIRRGVSVSSQEMQRLIRIDRGIPSLCVNFVATEAIISRLKSDLESSYRFIGKCKDVSDAFWVKLYEIIDPTDTTARENNIRTKSIFERAVQLYIDGAFTEARKLFVDVLNIDKTDKTALYYINVCDVHMDPANEKYDIGKFIGDLF